MRKILIALIAVFLLSFAFSPPDVSAKTIPLVQTHSKSVQAVAAFSPVVIVSSDIRAAEFIGTTGTQFVTAPAVAHGLSEKLITRAIGDAMIYRPPNLPNNKQLNQVNFNVPEIVQLR